MSISMNQWRSLTDEGQRDAVMDILKGRRENWTDLKTMRVLLWGDENPDSKSPLYSEAVALANTILPRMESLSLIEYDSDKRMFRSRPGFWTHRRVYVVGTFNRFHDGHRALMDRVAETAGTMEGPVDVILYVTSDDMARKTRDVPVQPLSDRLMRVMLAFQDEFFDQGYCACYILGIVKWRVLDSPDFFDPDAKPTDTVVCSEETRTNAERGGIRVVSVPMVLDDNGNEIHSTMLIRKGV